MSASLPIISAAAARQLFMDAQGLLDDPAREVTPATLQAVVERMGFVQLDSINIVERAHHLILASRFDDYRHDDFTRLLEHDRSLFEHWTHDASVIPTKWFRHWKPRFTRNSDRIRNNDWWQERFGGEPDAMLDHVRERIKREGPLQAAYSGIFLMIALFWGWGVDKVAPDKFDIIGALVALVGMVIIMYAPKG